MDWFRGWNGISSDPKFLRVMRAAQADGARVLGVWLALLDHASQAEPRGNVSRFDPENFAAFTGLEADDVQRVVDAFVAIGMIDQEGNIAAWERRQPSDKTAADRMRRYRARKKLKAEAREGGLNAGDNNPPEAREEPVALRNVTPRNAQRYTEERERSSRSSVASTSTDTSSGYKARNACAPARDWFGLVGWLHDRGVDAGVIKAGFSRNTIAGWQQSGATEQQLDEAITRAKRQMAANGEPDRLIPIRYLDRFVGDVLAGRASFASSNTRSQGYEAVDRNLADFVQRAGR